MKNNFKKILCILCACAVLFSAFSTVVLAAYPSGITAENCAAALTGTDALVNNAVPALTGQTLEQLLKGMLYNSDTLSSLLKGFYASMQQSSSEIGLLGIDTSVGAVAAGLTAYPEVYAALSDASDWNGVDLNGVDWGVTDRESFADALGCSLSPLNNILYMLLCGGDFKLASFITIKGNANGYEKGIVPILKAAGCENFMSQSEFTAAADENKNSMVTNILLPVLAKLENSLDTPAAELTAMLTNLAYFNECGGFKSSMQALLSPVLDNPLVEIAVFLKILNLDETFDLNSMVNNIISQAPADSGITVPEVDLHALAACGTVSGTTFTADLPAAYCEILRWLAQTLKLNGEKLPAVLAQNGEVALPAGMLNSFLAKDTDELTAALIRLFDPADLPAPAAMVYPAHTPLTVTYTPNLTKENYDKVLDEIDGILDQLVKDSFGYSSVYSFLACSVYTNENVNSLLTGLYGELEKQGLADTLKLLGMDITPAGVAAKLTEGGYSDARSALKKAEKWSSVKLGGVSWNFYDGSRVGFENALTAALRPLFPALRLVLSGEDLVILGGIKLKGGDGYNTAIIPVLEALGCDADSIPDYKQYRKYYDTDGVVKEILEPVFDLLDDVFDRPVYTLTGILPNIMYFLNSGSLEKCLENLMLPLTALAETFSVDMGALGNAASLTEKLDVSALTESLTKDLGIKLAKFDINTLSGYGIATKLKSKTVLDGKNTERTYIEADKTAVLMVLLRFLAETLQTPGNENLLAGSMGGDGAMAQYSGSIFKELEGMSPDELIEWLYNLLFKERAKVVIEEGDDYTPHIIFQKQEKDYTVVKVVGGVAAFELVLGIILYLNRKKMFYA